MPGSRSRRCTTLAVSCLSVNSCSLPGSADTKAVTRRLQSGHASDTATHFWRHCRQNVCRHPQSVTGVDMCRRQMEQLTSSPF